MRVLVSNRDTHPPRANIPVLNLCACNSQLHGVGRWVTVGAEWRLSLRKRYFKLSDARDSACPALNAMVGHIEYFSRFLGVAVRESRLLNFPNVGKVRLAARYAAQTFGNRQLHDTF